MVMGVPSGPHTGLIWVMVGWMPWKTKALPAVPVWAEVKSLLVTTTLAGPGVPAGETQLIMAGDTTTTEVAGAPPMVTVEPRKPLPVMVRAVPPLAGASAGLTAAMVGPLPW